MSTHPALLIAPLLLLASTVALSAQTQVKLFGQDCTLSGPFDVAALSALHSISPEQIPPSPKSGDARTLLERLKKITGVPAALDRYRERLTRRLEAQIAFQEGLAAAKKLGKPAPLLDSTKSFLDPKREKKFKTLANAGKLSGGPAIEELTEAYDEAIEPHPEEEFHRSIAKIKVRYDCSMEEGVESAE